MWGALSGCSGQNIFEDQKRERFALCHQFRKQKWVYVIRGVSAQLLDSHQAEAWLPESEERFLTFCCRRKQAEVRRWQRPTRKVIRGIGRYIIGTIGLLTLR